MRALIIVDVQNDFCSGGALAIPRADNVVPFINECTAKGLYDVIVATVDWHPAENTYTWPKHCIQGSNGAKIHPHLDTTFVARVFKKGVEPDVHPYGAFYADNSRTKLLELHAYLQAAGVTAVDIVGLATDYCVRTTVLDALHLGYKVNVLLDGCRGLAKETTLAAINEMKAAGANIA